MYENDLKIREDLKNDRMMEDLKNVCESDKNVCECLMNLAVHICMSEKV